jgi:hypothetical protein
VTAVSAATVFVLRSTAGGPQEVLGLRLDIVISGGKAHTSMTQPDSPQVDLELIAVHNENDAVEVIRRIVRSAKAGPGRKGATMTIDEAARYLLVSTSHIRQLLAQGRLAASVLNEGEYLGPTPKSPHLLWNSEARQ